MGSDPGGVNAVDQSAPAGDGQAPPAAGEQSASTSRQQLLPLPWHLIRPRGEAEFAHPAERDLSRILTYYRIRWVYEPTTFALAWTDDGQPSEMFTPDFYLPDHRLYIELTTMRQRLVTRKNRKLRRLRELYPTVRIKLLYRRDYHRLVDSYRKCTQDSGACRVGRVLFTEEQIRTRVSELADELAQVLASGSDAPVLALAIGAGARVFAEAMIRELRERGVAIDREAVRLSRFRAVGRHRVRIKRAPALPIAGRRILLLTDIVSTGLSLTYLAGWLRGRGAARVDICTLLDRREARLVDVPIPFAGFEAPNELLIGFGLHLRRQFRDLPYIATLAVD